MTNLNNQIKDLERAIKLKQKTGKNYSVESALIDAYKEYQEANPDGELDKDLLYNNQK